MQSRRICKASSASSLPHHRGCWNSYMPLWNTGIIFLTCKMLSELGHTLEVSKAKTTLTVIRLSKTSTKTTGNIAAWMYEQLNAVWEGHISKVKQYSSLHKHTQFWPFSKKNLQFLPRETAFHQDYRNIRLKKAHIYITTNLQQTFHLFQSML